MSFTLEEVVVSCSLIFSSVSIPVPFTSQHSSCLSAQIPSFVPVAPALLLWHCLISCACSCPLCSISLLFLYLRFFLLHSHAILVTAV